MTLAATQALARGTLDLEHFDNSSRWWMGAKVAMYEARKCYAEQQALFKVMGIETDITSDTLTLSENDSIDTAARWYLTYARDKLELQ